MRVIYPVFTALSMGTGRTLSLLVSTLNIQIGSRAPPSKPNTNTSRKLMMPETILLEYGGIHGMNMNTDIEKILSYVIIDL